MADAPATTTPESVTSAISNFVVAVTRDYTGRGPTRARTHLAEDLVTVVMQDTLTKGERHLIDGAGEALVLSTRRAYQETMRKTLVSGVERILDREVIAFMSANHVDPDYSIENFVLGART